MPTFAAFLKGMNLGRRRVKNEELCEAFEAMKFGDVSAFLASGNISFTTRKKSEVDLQKTIEQGLEKRFAYPVPTFLRSADEVRRIAAAEPFSAKQVAASEGKLQVALLAAKPPPARRKEALALATPQDPLVITERELYWLPAGRMTDSELDVAALGKVLGLMTIRTQRTLQRLVAKLDV